MLHLGVPFLYLYPLASEVAHCFVFQFRLFPSSGQLHQPGNVFASAVAKALVRLCLGCSLRKARSSEAGAGIASRFET